MACCCNRSRTDGLYGVMSYSVRERRSEIGVRLALGATPWRVRRTIVLEGAVVVAVGLAFGLIGAFGFSRFLASELYGVTSTDPLTFAVIPIVLTVISLGAVYVPAYRALQLEATLALRGEQLPLRNDPERLPFSPRTPCEVGDVDR